MTTNTATVRDIERLARRLDTAQARADAIRADLEGAVITYRAEGASLADIAKLIGYSRPGVLKMLRRHEAA